MFNKIRNILSNFRKRQRDGFPIENHLPKVQEEVECKNCGKHFSGAYCPTCGQTATARRITVKDTLNNIFAGFIGGDDIFFRTCRDLLWRPGYVVYDYLTGKRTRYFKPIHMLVRLVAIFVLLSLFIDSNELIGHIDDNFLMDKVHSPSLITALHLLATLLNNKVISALLLAFVLVVPFWLVFRWHSIGREGSPIKKLNLAEHFYTLIYYNCLSLILSFVFLLLDNLGSIASAISDYALLYKLFIVIWMYKQLYEMKWWRSILTTTLAFLLGLALIVVAVLFFFGLFYGIDAVISNQQ